MAAEKVDFELVSPSRLLVSEAVEMVVVPGEKGDFGALPWHAPMITTVRPGVIDVYDGGKVRKRIFVADGFVEMTETRLTVLAEEAINVTEITKDLVAARLKAAETAAEEAETESAREDAQRLLRVAQAMEQVVLQA